MIQIEWLNNHKLVKAMSVNITKGEIPPGDPKPVRIHVWVQGSNAAESTFRDEATARSITSALNEMVDKVEDIELARKKEEKAKNLKTEKAKPVEQEFDFLE